MSLYKDIKKTFEDGKSKKAEYINTYEDSGIVIYFDEEHSQYIKDAFKKYNTDFSDNIYGTKILIHRYQKGISELKMRKINFKIQIDFHPKIELYSLGYCSHTPHISNCIRYFDDIPYKFKLKKINESNREDKKDLLELLKKFKK